MTEEKRLDIGLLILRISLGITFIAHGYLQAFIFGIKHAMAVFEAHTVWHINMIPGWFAPTRKKDRKRFAYGRKWTLAFVVFFRISN